MALHHHHGPGGHDHDHSTGNLRLAFFLNLAFTIIELVGGLYTNSLAILSDALHDLGDSLSLGLAWYFEKLSKKGRTASFSYGYKRFSPLAALINANILVIGAIIILYNAIPRVFSPQPVDAKGMFFLALLGVAFNGLAVLRLKKGTSLNERVVMLHLLEDVLGWVAILIGSVVMWFAEIFWLDPVLSIVIALYILRNALKSLWATLAIFLQAVPAQLDLEKITAMLASVPRVRDVHDVHLWTMDGQYIVLTAHIVVDPGTSQQDLEHIKAECKARALQQNIQHATLELENPEEGCQLLGQ